MSMLDLFHANPAFNTTSLTAAINDIDARPTRLAELGLFNESGVTTTTVQVEKQGATLALVSAASRGANGQQLSANTRGLIPFNTIHLPQKTQLLADEIQNVRAFGSENEVQVLQNIVNERLARMRMQLDATIEYQRIGAIKGQILDADGTTVLTNILTAFGITKNTHAMALATAGTEVRNKIVEAKRKVEKELNMIPVRSYRILAGAAFFDAFISNESVKAAYDRWQDGQFGRDDVRNGFTFGGVTIEEYRGGIGSTPFIADDKAYLIPEGVPDLFITRFAPANYMETVNTIGLPYYAKQELMDFDKGVDIETQSNPISLCTRPRAVIELSA